MKHVSLKKMALAAAVFLGFGLSAQAQAPAGFFEKAPYFEDFEEFNTTTYLLGWTRSVNTGGYTGSYSTSTYGVDRSKCVGNTNSFRGGTYPNYTYAEDDFLVTPMVKGELSFYGAPYNPNSYEAFITVYKLNKNEDGTFSMNGEALVDLTRDNGTMSNESMGWQEYTCSLGDEYTYVGFRIIGAYIDNLTVDSALIPVNKELTLGNPSFMDGYAYTVNATEDGKYNMGVKVTVTNTGNVDLVAADEDDDYSISLQRVINTNPYSYVQLKTVKLPDLAMGASATVELEGEFDIPTDVAVNDNGVIRFRLDVMENLSDKDPSTKYKALSSWIEITPYESILDIYYDKKSTSNGSVTNTQVDPSKPMYMGAFQGQREVEFRLRNRGAAAMTVNTPVAPEWISFEDITFPATIAAGEIKSFKVVIGGDAGYKQGEITFPTNGLYITNKINLAADVVDDNEFFTDFEGENPLSGWYLPDGTSSKWSVGAWTTTERNYTESYVQAEYGFNDKRLDNTYQTPLQHIYTPKLAFGQGDNFSFYAAKKTNSGNDVKLVVRYSPDRANWTELGTITVSNEDESLRFSHGTSATPTSNGQNILKRFSFDMPEGEYYISLGAGYVLVDNFRGGTLVDVDYDIIGESVAAGTTRIQNNPLEVSATFKNIHTAALPAEGQVVALYADGKQVATAEAQAIEAGQTATYNFVYTPHAVGETEIYAVLSMGDDYTVNTPATTIVVNAESADNKLQVGVVASGKYTQYAPVYTYYKNSKTETVYPASMLADMDGTTITKLSFLAQKGSVQNVDRVTIWLSNSDDTTVPTAYAEFTPEADMSKVYESVPYTFEKAGGSSNSDVASMTELIFVLDEPFEYVPGKNLRVVMESRADNYNSTYFAYDDRAELKTFYYYNDTASTYEGGTGSKNTLTGAPVINLYTEAFVPEISGTVMDGSDNGIEGATIRATAVGPRGMKARAGEATAPDVYYETVTDVDGNWSMQIFQPDYSYVITVKAPGYEESEPVALDWDNMNDISVVLEAEDIVHPTNGTYTTSLTDDGLYHNIDIKWAMGDDNESEEFRGYTFDIALDGEHHGTTTKTSYRLENMLTGNYDVAITGTTPSGATTNTHIVRIRLDIVTGVVGIENQDGQWRYFDLNGIEINADQLDRGFYIRTNGRKTEKILINR